MKVYGYTINNKTYEGTVAITRDDFEDHNLDVYTPLFQEMGRADAAQPDELVFTVLRAGNKTDCYDGKPFFDSEHPVYPKVDGTGTAKKVANQLIEKTGSRATEKTTRGGLVSAGLLTRAEPADFPEPTPAGVTHPDQDR